MFSISLSVFLLFIILNKSSCEDFNLYGEAGQAYALEIEIGHPPQKLSVLVDTGSATLAIASYPRMDNDIIFHPDKSDSILLTNKGIEAKYSQGNWNGELAYDFVKFPSMKTMPEVVTDLGLIKSSHKFFINGSLWQGLLGLAYLPVGAWGDGVIAGSWVDSVEITYHKALSFQLKLCGVVSPTNASHYGKFEVLDDSMALSNPVIYKTPILKRRWYVVGVLSVYVLKKSPVNDTVNNYNQYEETCLRLNKGKSIVDSGTTNIRLPEVVFKEVVTELRNAALANNILILDEFWFRGEVACWPEPQAWDLPSIGIDLLSANSDNEYFTLEITTQNYMRVTTAMNSSEGSMSQFCYKLGFEAGCDETVLGYTAMEGFQVLFNRSSGWIGWQVSDCGPNSRISGPYNYSKSLLSLCQLSKSIPHTEVTIKAAQWALCAFSIIALAVLIYLLAPCVKSLIVRPLPRSQQISLSRASLVEEEVTSN